MANICQMLINEGHTVEYHGVKKQKNGATTRGKIMDMIINLITWVTGIVTVASLIAASTPTPKDDVWIGKL